MRQAPSIGIDHVQLTHHEQEVRECKTNVCGANGCCYEYDDDDAEPHCCWMPGFYDKRCELRHRPCVVAKRLRRKKIKYKSKMSLHFETRSLEDVVEPNAVV